MQVGPPFCGLVHLTMGHWRLRFVLVDESLPARRVLSFIVMDSIAYDILFGDNWAGGRFRRAERCDRMFNICTPMLAKVQGAAMVSFRFAHHRLFYASS